jgi:hypothetical protein
VISSRVPRLQIFRGTHLDELRRRVVVWEKVKRAKLCTPFPRFDDTKALYSRLFRASDLLVNFFSADGNPSSLPVVTTSVDKY